MSYPRPIVKRLACAIASVASADPSASYTLGQPYAIDAGCPSDRRERHPAAVGSGSKCLDWDGLAGLRQLGFQHHRAVQSFCGARFQVAASAALDVYTLAVMLDDGRRDV
jgi:hypothetical protein